MAFNKGSIENIQENRGMGYAVCDLLGSVSTALKSFRNIFC